MRQDKIELLERLFEVDSDLRVETVVSDRIRIFTQFLNIAIMKYEKYGEENLIDYLKADLITVSKFYESFSEENKIREVFMKKLLLLYALVFIDLGAEDEFISKYMYYISLFDIDFFDDEFEQDLKKMMQFLEESVKPEVFESDEIQENLKTIEYLKKHGTLSMKKYIEWRCRCGTRKMFENE